MRVPIPATVHRALAYAHDNPDEMTRVRAEQEAAFEAFREERWSPSAD